MILFREPREALKHHGTAGLCFLAILLFSIPGTLLAQMDQGTITGIVQDNTGAVIPRAKVTLTDTDTGLVLHAATDGKGVYVFSPIKIGHYIVAARAPGFKTTQQLHLRLSVEQRLNVVLVLKPGSVNQTVVVTSAPPLLQTGQGSVGETMSTRTINNIPLNGRNWVYVAQLAPGIIATPGSRGGATGDFSANGQRPEANDFILDGVDNNVKVQDYQNGTSYNMRPPPDALQEFRVTTSNYSAQFGYALGAVVNASVKSGTNHIHGDVWEYFRNTALDATNWNALQAQTYHENQFGATLGFPIVHNKFFYFGDTEANRISYANPDTLTVPTALMRQGNFSELLDTGLTGSAKPIQLYEPNSGGSAKLSCHGQNNVFCAGQIDPVAQKLLNLYPMPNANSGKTYQNYVDNLTDSSDTFQWDQRLDWNISSKDQAYARFSYGHLIDLNQAPLGPILDGTPNYTGQHQSDLSENGMASETHIFNPTLVNEVRFSYNWGDYSNLQENATVNEAANLGVGGVPFGPGHPFNGGLPYFAVSGITAFGTHGFDPSVKTQDQYQILDNLTKVVGNHSLKFGVDLQSIRISALSPPAPRGFYTYSGRFTSNKGASFTGYGVADFLADQMFSGNISDEITTNFARWYRAAYAEDNWRVNKRLTLNLGLRYEYFQPQKEMAGRQANLIITSRGIGTGAAVYQLPTQSESIGLSPEFRRLLTSSNIAPQYVDNPYLVSAQKANFAPRIGFAYQLPNNTVVHGGAGLFYGAFDTYGGANLGNNFPFLLSANFPSGNCKTNDCPSNGYNMEHGFAQPLAAGLGTFVARPTMQSTDAYVKTPVTIGYNLMMQRALTRNIVASLAYVGNEARHLPTILDGNSADALQNPANTPINAEPFPNLGGDTTIPYEGTSTYNALQASMRKRYGSGLSFQAAYTWSHTLDDSADALGGGTGYRNPFLIPILDEYTNATQDVRQRFTFNGYYVLPFGRGRTFLTHDGAVTAIVGGWATDLTFVAQTGQPFSVGPNVAGPSGGASFAIPIRDPMAAGGSPNPTNPNVTCASSTRNKDHWFNPCAFENPIPGTKISPDNGANGSPYTPEAGYAYPKYVRGVNNAELFLGGRSNSVYGPGYERVDMSLFKNVTTWHEQYLELRADIFNVMNHPSLGNPAVTGINSNAGKITGPKSLQADTPDARFIQLSAKYVF